MKIQDYKKIVKKTAVFPQKVENFGLAYGWLGLLDEMGEVGQAVMRYQQDKSFENRTLLVKEFGDVHWYIAAICEETGVAVNLVLKYDGTAEALDQYGSVASYCGSIKKFYRDNKKINPEEIVGVLASVYKKYIKKYMDINDITLEEVLQVNYDKLTKRKEEGKLKGDGDNR